MGKNPYTAKDVCAVILSGGQGTRMGGCDKGLQSHDGKALAHIAAQRLSQQVGGQPSLIAINANRNLADYARWGYTIWPDIANEGLGPLAGFDTALLHAMSSESPWPLVLTVPCDAPEFPLGLLAEFLSAMNRTACEAVFAESYESSPDGSYAWRQQPTFCLMQVSLHPRLRTYLQSGGRRVYHWLQSEGAVSAKFDCTSAPNTSFANINTLDDLAAIAAMADQSR